MYKCVELANLIACRFGLIALLCLVRQIWWNTEQPGGSVAQWLPYLQVPLHPDRTILGFQSSLIQRLFPGYNGFYESTLVNQHVMLQNYFCSLNEPTSMAIQSVNSAGWDYLDIAR